MFDEVWDRTLPNFFLLILYINKSLLFFATLMLTLGTVELHDMYSLFYSNHCQVSHYGKDKGQIVLVGNIKGANATLDVKII